MSSFLEKLRPKPVVHTAIVPDAYASDSSSVIRDGDLAFTKVEGGNGAGQTYQEAAGAPVESDSPLGYNVGAVTIIFLNVNKMIGTGIFSTPGSILRRTGSIGLALMYWVIGFFMAAAGFGTYLELASFFPSRSGSDVVYLEQAYPRPKHLMPIAFAVQSVILTFSSSNAIVLSQYLWRLANVEASDWQLKGVAIAAYTLAVLCVLVSNKYSLWAANGIGILKIITLVFISITGFVVLGGNVKSIPDPGRNFKNAFSGATDNGNDLSSALISIVFSYTGYENAFNVVAEIKNPIKTTKLYGAISLAVVTLLYMFCNIAYFAAVDKEVFAAANETAATSFFVAVFGEGSATKALNFLVLLSAFGNLLVVLIGDSRMIREIGRQGVLPYTPFWVSTKPFGTPFGPYVVKWAITLIMIVAPPAGDAFSFVVNLQSYPNAIFKTAMVIGLVLLRRRRARNNIARSEFRVWDVLLGFFFLIQVFIMVMPWWPPKDGPNSGDYSFWYATHCVVGIGIIIACFVYYYFWMKLLPKWKGYEMRSEILDIDESGANSHRLVKVPKADVAEWDATHDDSGNLRQRRHVGDSESGRHSADDKAVHVSSVTH
jgi:amino acid transporter